MFKLLKGAVALTVGLAAIAGCSAQLPGGMNGAKAPALATALKQALPDGWFSAPLKAPAGAKAAPEYSVKALPMYPHLIGPQYASSTSLLATDPVKVFNTNDRTYLVAFQDGAGNIKARISDDQGLVIISDFTVASGAVEPRLAYIPDLNQWVVIYKDTVTNHILLQRLGSAGSLIGGPVNVSIATGSKDLPDLAYDPINHKLLTTWSDQRSGNFDVYTRLFRFTGDQTLADTGEMLAINSPPDIAGNLGDHVSPRVAFSTTTQTYVVVCEDTRNVLTTGTDIFGQKITKAGSLLDGNFAVSDLGQRQGNPAIAYNPNTGYFVVVFEDDSQGNADQNITGRALNSAGTPVYSEGTVTNQYGIQANPSVAFNTGSWTWLVAWEEDTSTPTPTIEGRHFGPFFEVGNVFTISPSTQGFNPEVAADPLDQDFNVVFDQNATGTILGQRVDRGY